MRTLIENGPAKKTKPGWFQPHRKTNLGEKMRKSLTAAVLAAGVAAFGFAGVAAADTEGMNGSNSGAHAGNVSLVNVDASSAGHWQICGQNVLTQSLNQKCDNRDHIGAAPQSGAFAGDVSAANVDISDFAHWQICGQNVLVAPSLNQQCLNTDHTS
jgi:hypothetical protein